MIRNRKYRIVSRTIGVLFLLFISFSVYVVLANRNSKQMTVKQQILKAIYPAFMWLNKKSSGANKIISPQAVIPAVSFYTLKGTMINGKEFDFSQLKGKKVLLVNTASDCGYTGQYDDLEKLYLANKDKLVVIGFPANDFKQQEKADDSAIEQFCKINYGVSFPLMKKSVVIKSAAQNPVYKWLTHKALNGWNEKGPSWNFCKYLVDENGNLTHLFKPGVEPMGEEVRKALQ